MRREEQVLCKILVVLRFVYFLLTFSPFDKKNRRISLLLEELNVQKIVALNEQSLNIDEHVFVKNCISI